MLQNGRLEPTDLALQVLELTQGEQFNVGMAGTFDQFWRNDAHGAVVGWEGLVQLRHDPANGGRLFHQVNEKAGIGKIKRRLDAGDSATDHHD